ncbi:hypothetical protein RclHR1_01840001 [Rhizophagus clarus]|uniref:ATP-dependent DNA helicase n=1 Tax=Rhizophagus clarus TaxID=94130 RepID=A0A2Z6R0R4_9GLOM|nr:hypothetical protein RclHR1_01840001 [Rhizophagus clarus]
MAPTGVAAQNINGKIIHSELQIKPDSSNYISLAMKNTENRLRLKKIDVIIIDKISMVSPYLLDFINQMFCKLHNCTLPFGGIMVLLAGDLAQLPPIEDLEFFQILQQIRFNRITKETWEKLKEKLNTPSNINSPLETTYIMGYHYMVDTLNNTIMDYLPVDELDDLFISIAEDRLNYQLWSNKKSDKHFRKYTNFPDIIRIQRGTRVMFLNNTLYNNGIYNGSIWIITKIHDEKSIDVAFLTRTGLTVVTVNKTTDRFNHNGQPASRQQFPIQNAFALTVHKTQALTLLNITISLDLQMFAPGQAYVAISHVKTWDSLNLIGLEYDAFKTVNKLY